MRSISTAQGAERTLVFLAVVWGLSLWGVPAHDPDLGWHLLGGSWILDHGAVPRADFVNAFRLEWHDYHWLAQLPLTLLYRYGGYEALRIALGLVGAVLFLTLVALARRSKRGSFGIYPTLILFSAFLLVQEIATVRPQMAALVGVALAAFILVGRSSRSELPLLLLLTIILVNVHVYWVFVPYLWFIYRVVPRIVRTRSASPIYAWGGVFLLGGAGLFSPYGIFAPELTADIVLSNYSIVWDYLAMPEVLKSSINELRSALSASSVVQSIVLLYIIAVTRTFRWKRSLVDSGATLGAFTGILLAVLGIKYVPLTAIFCLPYLVRHTPALFHGGARFAPGVTVVVGVLAAYFGYRSWATYPPTHPNNEKIDDFAPYTACRELGRTTVLPRVHAPMTVLTHFNHGGWCRWALYEVDPATDYRVTTDNRTQGFPGEHFERSFDLFGAKRDWLATLVEWRPDAAVVQKVYPLAQFMGLSPDRWRKIVEDREFVVFVPQPVSEPIP